MASQVFTGRYQILRHLARGGMAEVYLARDLLLDRPVALKVLFPEFASDRSFVERFRREARAAANLNHPNIVSIYDWGEDGGTYFIVMEYVDGRTLREVIRGEGPLMAQRAAEIGSEIAAALSFAHRNGVVHRDVKPGNVMIAGQVKVTDFGIARAGDPAESLTQTGAVMGTATYFSPEQAQGQTVDARTDVYSLGVVLYEMVTGRPPFTGDNPVSIAYQHVRESPEPPSHHNPDIPPSFEAVVLKALAKNKANRYGSAEELRADLIRFRQGVPVSAEPVLAAADITGMHSRRHDDPQLDATRMNAPGPPTMVGGNQAPPPRRTGVYIGVLVAMLLLLAGMLFLLGRQLGVGSGTKVAVPAVVGDNEADATAKLADAGLETRKEVVTDENNAAGQVVDQDPVQGTRVESGSAVLIKVSSGAPPAQVPDVRNRNLDAARDALEQAGFTITVNTVNDDDVPPDTVVDQDPKPNTQAPRGSAVVLTVSEGPEQVRVPEVAGREVGEAANILGQAGFRTTSRPESNSNVPANTVIRTDPDAGTPLTRGSLVAVIVSSGPAPTTVPATLPPTTLPPPPTTVAPTTVPPTTTSAP